jgi:hypothetical protein
MALQTRAPTSDVEQTAGWTGSNGTRWQALDDHPDTTGADYLVGGTTAGRVTLAGDAFDVPAGSTITGVTVRNIMQRTGSQSTNARHTLRVGTTNYFSAGFNAANGVWTEYTNDWTTNPATSAAWTVDDVNGTGANPIAGFGVSMTDASPQVRWSSSQIEVEYTPPETSTPRAYAMFLG